MDIHKRVSDISGLRYGKLTVLNFSHMGSHSNSYWDCICDCGNHKKIIKANLSRSTKSCGCLVAEKNIERLTKHNKYGNKTYITWNGLKGRCTNKNSDKYDDYMGRGITICDKWLTFEGFYEDMGDRPEGMTLDRIDNNKGYCKENCEWANAEQQQNNKRNNVNITYKGKTQTLTQWSRELGIKRYLLNNRLFIGNWTVERAFETKKGRYKNG